jgi:hypothetical protein
MARKDLGRPWEYCGVSVRRDTVALPSTAHLLVRLEQLLFAMPPDQARALLDDAAIKTLPRADENARYDVAIDLTRHAEAINAHRVLRPVFDGSAGDAGAIEAVLEHRGPRLGLTDSETGFRAFGVRSGAPGSSPVASTVCSRAWRACCSRRFSRARARETRHLTDTFTQQEAAAIAPSRPLAFLSGLIARKASARLARRRGSAHHSLDIAWRNFTPFADGGTRYFATRSSYARNTARIFCKEGSVRHRQRHHLAFHP